jgi:hypothetical protein
MFDQQQKVQGLPTRYTHTHRHTQTHTHTINSRRCRREAKRGEGGKERRRGGERGARERPRGGYLYVMNISIFHSFATPYSRSYFFSFSSFFPPPPSLSEELSQHEMLRKAWGISVCVSVCVHVLCVYQGVCTCAHSHNFLPMCPLTL